MAYRPDLIHLGMSSVVLATNALPLAAMTPPARPQQGRKII